MIKSQLSYAHFVLKEGDFMLILEIGENYIASFKQSIP